MDNVEKTTFEPLSNDRAHESVDDQAKKNFAKSQYEFLKERYKDRKRVSRIFKAAGPGQIQEAYKLATSEDWSTKDGRVRLDLLDCLLTGAGGMQEFSWYRMKRVLAYNDFYVPEAKSHNAFFRIIDGAMEILFPGSFPFTDEELFELEHEKKKES